jgi:type III secretion system chaperone SycN
MASFSVHALRSIEAFASSMGLPAQPARDGSFTFVFQRSGTLSLTPATDGVQALVSLARMPDRLDGNLQRRALARAGLNPLTNKFLHAGVASDGSLIFAMSIEDTVLDLPTLESCFRELVAAHDEVA